MKRLLASAAFVAFAASGAVAQTVGFSQIGSESGWRAAETTLTKQQAEERGIDLKFSDAQQKQENQIAAIRSFIAQGVDAILTPATPSSAFGLGEMKDADPVKMYLNDVFTVTVNLAGLPGIAVPAGLDSKGLPLGLQLIGRPWEEGDLLNTAYALEKAAGFVAKPAKWW